MRRAPAIALLMFLTVPCAFANERLAGRWTLDRQRSEDIGKAIEETIRTMNFVTRPVARGRLRKTNPAYTSISLAFTAAQARITAGPGAPIILPASGAPVRWKREDGETFTVSGKLQNGTYVETFEAKDGRRTNAFSPTSDGTLTMHVTVTSPRLPTPLRYKLVYKRT
jgi:hypothetical protein